MIYSNAYTSLAQLRKTFGKFRAIEARRFFYLALVCSQLTYCSQLWKPYLIKDIFTLIGESLEVCHYKYILNDYTPDY